MIVTRKTEVLEEKLVPVPLVHQASFTDWPGIESKKNFNEKIYTAYWSLSKQRLSKSRGVV
jgi:hypothetical protein